MKMKTSRFRVPMAFGWALSLSSLPCRLERETIIFKLETFSRQTNWRNISLSLFQCDCKSIADNFINYASIREIFLAERKKQNHCCNSLKGSQQILYFYNFTLLSRAQRLGGNFVMGAQQLQRTACTPRSEKYKQQNGSRLHASLGVCWSALAHEIIWVREKSQSHFDWNWNSRWNLIPSQCSSSSVARANELQLFACPSSSSSASSKLQICFNSLRSLTLLISDRSVDSSRQLIFHKHIHITAGDDERARELVMLRISPYRLSGVESEQKWRLNDSVEQFIAVVHK